MKPQDIHTILEEDGETGSYITNFRPFQSIANVRCSNETPKMSMASVNTIVESAGDLALKHRRTEQPLGNLGHSEL